MIASGGEREIVIMEGGHLKIGVCGIACEKCPRMVKGQCPNGQQGCRPKENKFCKIAACAFGKKNSLCFNARSSLVRELR